MFNIPKKISINMQNPVNSGIQIYLPNLVLKLSPATTWKDQEFGTCFLTMINFKISGLLENGNKYQ